MPPIQESVATVAATADTGNGSEEAKRLLILAAGIVHSAETVRLNRDNTIAFSRRVNELVVTIATELQERDADDAALAPSLLEGEVLNFERAIQAAHDDLMTRGKRSYVSQLLHREADAEKLVAHGENIHQACNTIIAAGYVRHWQSAKAALQQFENSRALEALEAHRADVAQHTSSDSRTTSSLNIPPRPQIFFGRAAELSALQSLLVAGPAGRVAVLGGPGMGKTSLAATALHVDDIVARYGNRRFFVPCDAGEERNHCVFHIAATLGIIAAKRQDAEKALLTFLSSAPTLIVLDNFESVWESLDRRLDAERTLQSLANIESLALVITMRGTELPDGVLWTKPLLRPLQPLQPEASLQTFMAISDDPQDDHTLSVLLELVENVPLAVTLLANLAQVESCASMLRRWTAQKTTMLQRSDGTTKLTSLDVSISISILSPRMQSETAALQLLSLLSVLKHGPIDTDLGLMISDALCSSPTTALSVLLRTALCQRMFTGRLHVLSPIRQFMLKNYPICEELARPLYTHYFLLAGVFRKEKGLFDFRNPSLLAEVDDVFAVVQHALHSSSGSRSAVQAAIATGTLYVNDGVGSPDLLFDALTVAEAEGFDDLSAKCVEIWAQIITSGAAPGDAVALLRRARTLYEKVGDVQGVIETTLHSAQLLPLEAALTSFEQIRSLVESLRYESPALFSHFVIELGDLYMRAGRTQDARATFYELLAIQRHSPNPDPRVTAMAALKVADIEADAGHLHAATRRLHELIEQLRIVPWLPVLALTYQLLGRISLKQGRLDIATRYLQNSHELFRSLHNARNMLIGSFGLIRGLIGIGDITTAADVLLTAQDVVETLGVYDVCERTMYLHASGEIALSSGDLGTARLTLQIAVITSYRRGAVASDEHLLAIRANVLASLGDVESQAEDIDQARIDYLGAAAMNRKLQFSIETARGLCGFAQVIEDSAAEPLLVSILPLVRLWGLRPLLANALVTLGAILTRRGNFERAEARLKEALSHYEAMKNSRGSTRARIALESLKADRLAEETATVA